MVRIGILVAAVVSAGATATPAAAQEKQAPPGTILVIREVGPRNALHSTNGDPLWVRPSPEPGALQSILSGAFKPISDSAAASVNAGQPFGGPLSTVLQPLLGDVFTNGGAASREAGGGAVGGGGLGSTISSAVNQGLGSMRSALGSIPGGGR